MASPTETATRLVDKTGLSRSRQSANNSVFLLYSITIRTMKPTCRSLLICCLMALLPPLSNTSAQTFPSDAARLGNAPLAAKSDATDTVLTIEISSDALESPGTQQRWMQMLQKVGADRVVSKTRRQGTAKVEENSVGNIRTIRVFGFLAAGRLTLPGGKFRITDTGRIRDLLQKFRDDGKETTLAEKFDFGLTVSQLVALSEKLAKPVDFSTQGKPLADVAGTMINGSGIKVVRDRRAKASLASDELVTQEFEGMAIGTALAAVTKPYGLVLEPGRKQGEAVEIQIKSAQDSNESWPIGRKPKQAPVMVAPKLFQKMPIGIKNFPLDKVLAAFQKKAQMPIIFDREVLARKGIDVAKTKVSINHKDGVLALMISRLLRQSKPKMSYELRVDDAGKTFLWITVK